MTHSNKNSRGFTLVEVLVATAILSLLMWMVFAIIHQISKTWKSSSNRIESFQGARAVFESMTRKISQTTLNPYYDYFDAAGHSSSDSSYNGTPVRYGRNSELHFISGKALAPGQITHAVFFQAPLGETSDSSNASLKSLLNGCGYFLWFGPDAADNFYSARPAFITNRITPLRYRYRLMEFSQPSEALQIYNSTGTQWFKNFLVPTSGSPPAARALAENIIALILLPKKTDEEEKSIPAEQRIGADFEYDSRVSWPAGGGAQPEKMNQLPPILKIIMVAIDEASASRLQGATSTPPDLGIDPSTLFQKAASLNSDLDQLDAALTKKKINHRTFETEVSIHSAHWSSQ